MAWNPTRPLLASCSTDKTVRLYSYHFPSNTSTDANDLTSRSVKPVFQFLVEIPTAHKRTIRSIAWSPSGRTLATASFDSTVGVWEEVTDAAEGIDGAEHTDDEDGDVNMGAEGPTEWECVTTLEGHESECKSVGYSSDGALLASCSRDKSVWVWEGELYPSSMGTCVEPNSLSSSARFRFRMYIGHDGAYAGCESARMASQGRGALVVKSWAFSDLILPRLCPQVLASASYDASILLFADDPDADWGPFQKLQPSLPAQTAKVAQDLFDPSTRSVSTTAVGVADHTDDSKTDTDEFEIPPLKDPETIWSLAFSPCGMFLASGGDNGGIRIWARG